MQVYFKMCELGRCLKEELKMPQAVLDRHKSLWQELLHSDIHAAGFCLDSEYWNMEFGQLDNHEVMEGLRNMCVRVLGNYSEEGNWTCNDDAVERAMSQYVEYMTKVGAFSRESIINSARTQPAWRFWMMNCQWAPELRKVAMKVLSQVCNFPSLFLCCPCDPLPLLTRTCTCFVAVHFLLLL